MDNVVLTDALLAKLAGWEAVKAARSLVAAGRVVNSEWQPPSLTGTVQEGGGKTIRSGLIIKSASDAENLCPCRDSRQRGLICSHSVALGLHYLNAQKPAPTPVEPKHPQPTAPKKSSKAIRRASGDSGGEPLELFLILPPNFSEAVTRGRVMIYLEGKWREGRTPLNALPLNIPFTLSAQDLALLNLLESLSEGDTPAMLMLNSNQLTELLPKLIGHPNVTFGRAQPVEVSSESLCLKIQATLQPNGEIVLRSDEKYPSAFGFSLAPTGGEGRGEGGFSHSMFDVRCSAFDVSSIPNQHAWLLQNQTFRPLDLPPTLSEILRNPIYIPRNQIPQFLNFDWPSLTSSCDVQANFSLDDFEFDSAKPRFKLHLAGGLAILQAKLECFYDGKPVTPGATSGNEALWLPDPESPTRYRTRNFEMEQTAIARLTKYGFTGPDAQGLRHLKGQNEVLNFFAREYPRLEKEWDVTLEERLEQSTQKNLERIEPKFQVTPSGEEWFNLNVSYDTRGGERFAAADIQRLLLSGQSHTRLKNGKFAILDTGAVEELQEVLLDCSPEQHAGSYRLNNSQSGFLDATLRNQTNWKIQAPATWTQRAAQQSGEVKIQPPDLGNLESVLRPYQKDGVAWLSFLRANNFGGILADEMGLGKTLQILALLRTCIDRSKNTSPYLVVCPTSLVFNWAAEAAKFTPELRVLALHGPQRHQRFAQIPDHDLIITSYALLRRDLESYRTLEFDTVVLDEAQHIKNRQTQNAQAVKTVRARHRLVLTGTPIENSVLDLWSIFDFLMPGYLGNAQDFRERYEMPIVRDKDLTAQSRLARRLRPFLLRRLKRDVARDLPEKIEQVSFCELNDEQRALYQQVLDASRREILETVNTNGLAKSRMVILTALLRLRQICCDIRLLGSISRLEGESRPSVSLAPTGGEGRGEGARPGIAEAKVITHDELGGASVPASLPSGKTELFSELLEEVLDGGHRVLVFSQFTAMLGLLRDELTGQGIDFCYLDGSTKDRAAVVEKFQRDSRIPVFLISLKAGGVGLNLTGADTVIHFDPWWNPAVEAQATDRAHRIGQKKVVTSYKLITRGTVEEKILNLQTRKRALTQSLLTGEEQLTESLSWEEIQDLLTT